MRCRKRTKNASVGQVVTSDKLFNVITRKCKHGKLLLIRLTESRKWNKIGRQSLHITRLPRNETKRKKKLLINAKISSTSTNDLQQSKRETFGYLLNEYQNNIAQRVSKCHPVFIWIFISPQSNSKRFCFPILLSHNLRLSHFHPSESSDWCWFSIQHTYILRKVHNSISLPLPYNYNYIFINHKSYENKSAVWSETSEWEDNIVFSTTTDDTAQSIWLFYFHFSICRIIVVEYDSISNNEYTEHPQHKTKKLKRISIIVYRYQH